MVKTEKKPCKLCGEIHPLEHYYKNATSKDGRAPYCKKCFRDKQRECRTRRKARKEQIVTERQCCHCGKVKPAGEFYDSPHITGGISYRCKDCDAKRSRERIAERKEEDPGRYRADYLRSSAKSRGFVEHPDYDHEEMVRRCRIIVGYEEAFGKKLHCDHIIPLKYGGFHHQDAVQWISPSLNSKKCDSLDFRHPDCECWLDLPWSLIPDGLKERYRRELGDGPF